MRSQTQESLNQSQAFLRDCVELAHLQLKSRLEAMKRGENIDWKETREIVREGRTAARQLAQIASLELREAKQQRREPQRAPAPQLKVAITAELAMRFVNGTMEWQKLMSEARGPVPMPADLRKLFNEVGLDPDREESFDALFEALQQHPEFQRAAA